MGTRIDFKPLENVKRPAPARQPPRRALVGVTSSGGFTAPRTEFVVHLFSVVVEEILIITVPGMSVAIPVDTQTTIIVGGDGGSLKVKVAGARG